jgi:hypothetical protein
MTRDETIHMRAHGIPLKGDRERRLTEAETEAVEGARREVAWAGVPRKECARRTTEAQWHTTEQRTTEAESACTAEPDGTTVCRLRLPADVTPAMVEQACEEAFYGGQR